MTMKDWLYILSEKFPSFPFVDNFQKWLKIGQPNFRPVENNGKIIPNQLLMGGSSVDRHRQSCFRKNAWNLEWFHDWWFPISIVGYAWISHVLRFRERFMAAKMIRWCYTNFINTCMYTKTCTFTWHTFTYIYTHTYTVICLYKHIGKTPSSCIGKMRRNNPGSIWIHSRIYLHETQATGSKGTAFWMEIGHNLAWFDMTVEYIYVFDFSIYCLIEGNKVGWF